LSQRGPDLLQAAFTAGQRLLDAASAAVVTVTVLPADSPVGQVVAANRRVRMVTAAPVDAPGWPGLPVRLELRPVPIARRLPAGSLVAHLHAYVGEQDVVVPVHVTTALALSRLPRTEGSPWPVQIVITSPRAVPTASSLPSGLQSRQETGPSTLSTALGSFF
jgi:hypothetical protein